jgi:hypothetical protein
VKLQIFVERFDKYDDIFVNLSRCYISARTSERMWRYHVVLSKVNFLLALLVSIVQRKYKFCIC